MTDTDENEKPDFTIAFVGLPKAISNIRGLRESFDKRCSRRRKRGDKAVVIEMNQAAKWKQLYRMLGGKNGRA